MNFETNETSKTFTIPPWATTEEAEDGGLLFYALETDPILSVTITQHLRNDEGIRTAIACLRNNVLHQEGYDLRAFFQRRHAYIEDEIPEMEEIDSRFAMRSAQLGDERPLRLLDSLDQMREVVRWTKRQRGE